LYLDGNDEGSLSLPAPRPPRSDSIQHAALGTAMTSTGVAAGFFQGVIDEARVWSVARTQTQIQGAHDTDISAAQTGLIGHWGLNEGAGSTANNTFGTAGINGTLAGSPTWTSGFVVPDTTPPAPPANLTATAALNTGINLSWSANSESDL